MRVDFIPMALKNPTDPTTDSITTTTPDRPSSTYKKQDIHKIHKQAITTTNCTTKSLDGLLNKQLLKEKIR